MTGRYKARSLFTSRHHCSCPSLGEQSDQLGVSPGFLGCLLWGFVWPKRKIRFFFDYWSVVCPGRLAKKSAFDSLESPLTFNIQASALFNEPRRTQAKLPSNFSSTSRPVWFDFRGKVYRPTPHQVKKKYENCEASILRFGPQKCERNHR